MVIRGPFEHPGANAVEDENGRLVNLTHLSVQVASSPDLHLRDYETHDLPKLLSFLSLLSLIILVVYCQVEHGALITAFQ